MPSNNVKVIASSKQVTAESNRREIQNMVMLGSGFMVMFTAFNTMENLEKPFLASATEDDPTFTADGYVALGILYLFFGISLWLAPSIISLIGPRVALAVSSLGYSAFIASFYLRKTWLVYGGSVVNGLSAALLWTAQGNYTILNSRPKTITRNTSIFWVLFKCSLFFGNAFVFFMFRGKTRIDHDTGNTVIVVLFAIAAFATFLMLFLRKPEHESQKRDEASLWASRVSFIAEAGPMEAFTRSVRLALKPRILMLCPLFCYFGFQVSYHSGIYSACVGFTRNLGEDSKKLIPLVGIFIGLGELVTGSILILKGTHFSKFKWGGVWIVSTGFVVQATCFFMVFLNLPNAAVFGDTYDTAILTSNIPLCLLCGMMIGIGDGCFTSQIYSLLETMYPNDSSQTVALFNFINALASATSFYSSTMLGLHTQLLILVLTGLTGSIGYAVVTAQVKRGVASQALSTH
ncbi:UNC93-like protein MFSD11 isoform X1 [Homalodisca vitripennis]|nr:UNC93-like protein MFSD11 isoform X1 [Homalodisca vitripennis]